MKALYNSVIIILIAKVYLKCHVQILIIAYFILASGSSGFSSGVGGTLVQKHIYVHVAPPEPEELRPQRPISAGQSTKHYKIIFIKAPSYDLQQQQILQAQVCAFFKIF